MVIEAKEAKTKEPPVIKGKINLEAINRTGGFTPRVQAMRERYLKAVSKVSADRPWYMVQSYRQTEGQHPAIRRAKALANVWDNKAIAVHDLDLIMGNFTDAVRGAHPPMEYYPEQMRLLLEKNEAAWTNSASVQADLSKADFDKLIECARYWEANFPNEEQKERWERLFNQYDPDDIEREWSYTGVNWAPEYLPKGKRLKWRPLCMPRPQATGADFEKALKVGYKGLIRESQDHIEKIKAGAAGRDFFDEEKEKLAFLESTVIVLQAVIRYARRYAALAEEKAAEEKDPQRRAELLKAAEACRWVPENPARTFLEAVQSFWFTAMGVFMDKCQPNVFAGRFDQYMFPYYMADINEGRMTRQEAAELFGCLIMKLCALEPYMTPEHRALSQGTNYENITVGGCDVNGKDASNELSCMVLHVAKDTRTHQPYISLRYDRKTAPELIDKALECNRKHGAGVPAFFGDRTNIEYMLSRGHTLEHARDHAIAGCVNCVYPKTFAWMRMPVTTNNEAKMLEVALHRGVDPRTGIKIGIDVGDPRDFKTFEELKEAYKKEVSYFLNLMMDHNEVWQREVYIKDGWYWPFISAHMEGCIDNGRDVSRMGAAVTIDDANFALDRFFQDTSDSLMAIKKLVFEQEKYTMEQILTAIDANWEGYDRIRADCMAQPKYGNDNDEADALMNELWTFATDIYMSRTDIWGRYYTIYRQGSSVAASAGKTTGALPNGRKAGEWLSDASLSPVQQADQKGPTAVINSVTKLDFKHMDGTLLNMKLCPSLVDKPGGMTKFRQLIDTYFDKGGQEIQFNILDRDTLLDAQKNPKNYRDLLVRVAGYSAFWVDLEKQVQDEIIRRTEHEM